MRALCAVAGLGLFAVAALHCSGSEFVTYVPGAGGSAAGSGGSSGGSGGSATGAWTGSGGGAGKGTGGHVGGTGGDEGTGGAATGGQTGSGGQPGSGGQTGTGGQPGTGGDVRDASVDVGPPPFNSGDCKTDLDCLGTEGRCVELSKGGYRVCQFPVPPPATCTGSEPWCCPPYQLCPNNQICVSAPAAPFCGGAMPGGNTCVQNKCSTESDCPAGVCVPAGALGYKMSACMPAPCRLDKDCPGNGICAPVTLACCGGPTTMACVYKNQGGCRSSTDCCSSTSCGGCAVESGGKSYCIPPPVMCPA